MFKKCFAIILAVCIMGYAAGCSAGNGEKIKNSATAYIVVGTLGSGAYIFDGNIKSRDGGNVKCVDWGEYEEKENNYDDMEAYISGTYKWTPENETLCITFKRDDRDIISTYFVKGDFLIPDSLIKCGVDANMSGNYLDCTVQSVLNVTEYYPDGTYCFYMLDPETLKPKFNKSSTFGVYYIKDHIVYEKSSSDDEYKELGFVWDNKLYDLSLSMVLKRDK